MDLLPKDQRPRGKWPVTKRWARPLRVELHFPILDHELRLFWRAEDLSVLEETIPGQNSHSTRCEHWDCPERADVLEPVFGP